MLLLLSRLYPSTLDDGGDPSLSLQPFIPLVLRYSYNCVYNYTYSIVYVCIHYVCLYVSTVYTYVHGHMVGCYAVDVLRVQCGRSGRQQAELC